MSEKKFNTISDLLFSSPCKDNGLCRNPNCDHAVGEFKGGWFVLFGHAGFNSPTNNRFGYASKAKALAAMRRYLNK